MNEPMLTAGAWRALELARRLAGEVEAPRVEPLHLLWALLLEESRASELLAGSGLGREALGGLCPLDVGTLDRLVGATQSVSAPEGRAVRADWGESVGDGARGSPGGGRPRASGEWLDELMADARSPAAGEPLTGVVFEARRRAARGGDEVEVSSEHLLWGLAVSESPVATVLRQVGLDAAGLAGRTGGSAEAGGEPIATDVRLAGAPSRGAAGLGAGVGPVTTGAGVDVLRVLDAAANRAREGLRVLEDHVRFVLDDAHLTRLLKDARHELTAALTRAAPGAGEASSAAGGDLSTRLLAARDTPGDVGTAIHTASEAARGSVADVVAANFKRVQEAVRTLEEFGKVVSPDMGEALGRLRYRLYTLEKAVALTRRGRDRLAGCRLYLLVTRALCRRDMETVVREAIAGGVDVVQWREKSGGGGGAAGHVGARDGAGASAQSLDAPYGDRELLEVGRRVREWTREGGALFIMNDRPDLAVLCDADGVHVGQDELPVRDARRIVGPQRLVGVSTHTIEQARQAVLDGADYLGVGPVFPSRTKEFESLAGLEFVRQAASEITLPWFAIGGITAENAQAVLDAGAERIAVSGAICGAEDPREAARGLVAQVRD